MISKRILISMIVIISLVQFITYTTATGNKGAEVNPKGPVKPKYTANKSATTDPDPKDAGMNPDEDTAVEPEKPTSLRQKIFKRVKSIFWPIRFLYGKFKDFKNRVQNRNKKTTAMPVSSESNRTNFD